MATKRQNYWSFKEYWNAVLGAERGAQDVLTEFDLNPDDRTGLDEWLGVAEEAALCASGITELPPEWAEHHQHALAMLQTSTAHPPVDRIDATPASWATVPEHLWDGVRRWVNEGLVPGRFLQCVICNDLAGAATRADPLNARCLADITLFFVRHCPAGCWGKPEVLDTWPAQLRKARRTK